MEKKEKEKEIFLINTILTQRKEASKIISNQIYNILSKHISKKEYIIIKRIIFTRKNSAIKIQSFIRGYLIRQKIQNYISKTRTCYLIETGFTKKFKNLQMIVHLNNKNKVFDLYHDKFFNKYIFFMDRTLIHKKTYKIQFINEGKIIIDSNYETYEEKGIYYNIIDFKKIKKNEEKRIKNNDIEIKSACNFLKEKNLSIYSKNTINEDEKNEFKSRESLDTRIDTPNKILKNIDYSNPILKRRKSCILKGILKTRSSTDRKLRKYNSLKVTFGMAEFSY